MGKLDQMREEYGKSIHANDICRCPKHNQEVGGVSHSAHIATDTKPGEAADLKVADNHERFLLMRIAMKFFVRIEDAPTWLHVDVSEALPQEDLFRK